MDQDRETSLDRLNQTHEFPGRFMFKIIGENSPELVAGVVQAAVTVLGPKVMPTVTTRESAHGRHQAITMVVDVQSAEGVLDVYAALRTVSGVRLLL